MPVQESPTLAPPAQIGRREKEIKFAFSPSRTTPLLAALGARTAPDGAHPFGRVTSVYYDTPTWDLLREKINSDRFKSKIRLRWYRDLATGEPVGNAFLEAKLKEGGVRRKARIETDWPAARVAATRLDDPGYRELLGLLRAEGFCVPPTMLPAFELGYARRRFVEKRSGARVSVDTEITATRTNPMRLPLVRDTGLDESVLEVKGRGFDLPPALGDLRRFGLRRGSFSKYAACYQRLTGTSF